MPTPSCRAVGDKAQSLEIARVSPTVISAFDLFPCILLRQDAGQEFTDREFGTRCCPICRKFGRLKNKRGEGTSPYKNENHFVRGSIYFLIEKKIIYS